MSERYIAGLRVRFNKFGLQTFLSEKQHCKLQQLANGNLR